MKQCGIILITLITNLLCLNTFGQSVDTLGSTTIFYFIKDSDIYVNCSHSYENTFCTVKVFRMEPTDSRGSQCLCEKDSLQLSHFEKLSKFVFKKYGNPRYDTGKLRLFEFVRSNPEIKHNSFCLIQNRTKGGYGMHLSNLNLENFKKESHKIGSFYFLFSFKQKGK
jgi:hypothetical protein